MKRKISAILMLFFFAASFSYAQNAAVEKINSLCYDTNKKISEEEGFNNFYMFHIIDFESNVRAIGKQNTRVTFFYTQPGDSLIEQNGVTNVIDVYRSPVKIDIEYNIAASSKVHIRYYTDEAGNLMYYKFTSTGYATEERNYYFDKGKIIYINNTMPAFDDNTIKETKIFKAEKDFPKEYLKKSEEILKKFIEYKDFFFKMINIEKLDK